MKISVVIPTYKPDSYIWECLDSLENQTLPRSEYEVVLVLNGCNEPFNSQISEYISNSSVNYQFVQTNQGGVSNARNIGLDLAQGEYITFIDDDDYVSPSYLEELGHLATPDIVAISSAKAFYDETKERAAYGLDKYYSIYSKIKGPQKFYKCRKFFSGPVMKLIHRDIIGDRRFDIQFKNGEDNLFLFLISDKLKYVRFTSENAIYYRRYRADSAMQKPRSCRDKIKNSIKIVCKYLSIYVKGGYLFAFFCTRILAEMKFIMMSVLKAK